MKAEETRPSYAARNTTLQKNADQDSECASSTAYLVCEIYICCDYHEPAMFYPIAIVKGHR